MNAIAVQTLLIGYLLCQVILELQRIRKVLEKTDAATEI